MTFFNWFMLFGLIAIAIPIIIHLLNRRRARVIEWGAMRFLLAALASRNRRIRLEEIILLTLRCLWLALLALAMAQPLLTDRSAAVSPLVVPAILVGAMVGGVAAAMWSDRRWRLALVAISAALLLGGGASLAWEYMSQEAERSATAASKDVAIVIDGSSSMTLSVDGTSNFQRAVDEARAVIAALEPRDAVALVLAGSVPQGIVPGPLSDHKQLNAALDGLKPCGGTMQVVEALKSASAALAKGKNPGKKIVLITDGQDLGWNVRSESAWQSLAAGLPHRIGPTQIIVRTLSLPSLYRNLTVANVSVSRRVVGTDRPVRIDVTVTNTGTEPLDANEALLTVDGASTKRYKLPVVRPNASETAHFDHRFDRVGRHVLRASLATPDDLPVDNAGVAVVDVIGKVKVLIVDGAPAPRAPDGQVDPERTLEGAGGYLAVALGLGSRIEGLDVQPGPAPVLQDLVAPKVIELTSLKAVRDFSEYGMVVLANVSMVPEEQKTALVSFVRGGGGLLIVTGDRSGEVAPDGTVRSFYNDWKADTGDLVAPARLVERRVDPNNPARIAQPLSGHPALDSLEDPYKTNAYLSQTRLWWKLAEAPDSTVRVAGQFSTREPFLIERKLGKGYVLMTAMSLDERSGNLPKLPCFVPMMHELAYFLVSPTLSDTNVRPGAEVSIAPPEDVRASGRQLAANESIQVILPSQRRLPARLVGAGRAMRVQFAGTYEPGLYQVVLPPSLVAGAASQPADLEGIPFAVQGEPEESRLTVLTDADLGNVKRNLRARTGGEPLKDDILTRVKTHEDLIAAVTRGVVGQPLWEYLEIALLVALLAEIGLARWIALQRRTHQTQTITFGDESADVQSFRARAKELLAIHREQQAEATSKP
jgi:hypothetical protein